ncbi:MAG: dethiobiotin synthase [Pirellulales bacterium]|jgi:dethiobiotin synthetase|nr:dethiobiotin synthase [Pirellulales bacterium]
MCGDWHVSLELKVCRMRGLFITGTDTGVGKTYVAALIARQLVAADYRVGVYKPVASGCSQVEGKYVAEDAVQLWQAAGCPGTLEHVCPQRFAAPLAPPLSAQAEGKEVDANRLRDGLEFWKNNCDIVLVEGAGGLMSPISDDDYNADLAIDFGYPLVVVAPNVLGTINATLQTLITASTYDVGLEVCGIVLNGQSPLPDKATCAGNLGELKRRAVPPVLTTVVPEGDFQTTVPWWQLAGRKQ